MRRKRITYSPTAERRAVLYARYSSSLQADSWSIDAQLADLREHCARMGWQVLDDVCLDEAITGKTEDRPGLDRAMGLIREGKANVLVVHKLDRFFRNMAKTFEYVAELERYGAGLVCTQQPIDTTNPVSGKIVLAVMAALAEIYLDNLSEETAKGKKARASAGLPNGDLPYGYVVSKAAAAPGASNRATGAIVALEAEAVASAFEWYSQGLHGDGQIARMLNNAGYRMRSKWHPEGGTFTKDTISVLLMNPFYAGWVVQPTADLLSWSDRLQHAPRERGMHDPIVSQELFDRVQQIRAERRGVDERTKEHRGGVVGQRHHAYIAAGLGRCGVCGIRLRAQGKIGRPAQYRCTRCERGEICASKRKSIKADTVDTALGVAVAGLQLPPKWQARMLSFGAEEPEAAAAVEARQAGIDRKLARIKQLLVDGDLDQKDYRAERSRLEAERAALAPPAEHVDLEKAAALLQDLGTVWTDAGAEEQKTLAGRLFEAVYCDLEKPGTVDAILRPLFHPLWDVIPHGIIRVTDGA
jgi:DNA invertase Pin-like site-specific DNA recombinase